MVQPPPLSLGAPAPAPAPATPEDHLRAYGTALLWLALVVALTYVPITLARLGLLPFGLRPAFLLEGGIPPIGVTMFALSGVSLRALNPRYASALLAIAHPWIPACGALFAAGLGFATWWHGAPARQWHTPLFALPTLLAAAYLAHRRWNAAGAKGPGLRKKELERAWLPTREPLDVLALLAAVTTDVFLWKFGYLPDLHAALAR